MTADIVEQRTDRCVFCGTTRGDHNDYDCGTFVDPDDLCTTCDGSGYEATNADFTDGMRCRDCAGQGWVTA